jgi:hypothetical protein
MYPLYEDIRDRLGEPLWHDQNGVPRYAEFHPDLLGVYDVWALEMIVTCEGCGREFLCCSGIKHYAGSGPFEILTTPGQAMDYLLGWGDAPWHMLGDIGCPGTTNRADFTPLRLWHRGDAEWTEVPIPKEYK